MASRGRRSFAIEAKHRREGGSSGRRLEVGLGAAGVPPPAPSLQLGRRDPTHNLLGRPEVTHHIGIAQMRRHASPLGVPQDLIKQTDLGHCLAGGVRRPESDEQWRLRWQSSAPPVRLPVRMMWEPAGQGGDRLRGELDHPTLAQATSSCKAPGRRHSIPCSPISGAHTSLGRRPTSPSSRRMALSRRPKGVVRSGSRSSRSYWEGEMVTGGGSNGSGCRSTTSGSCPRARAPPV